MSEKPGRSLRLLQSVPNKVYNRLIVRYPYQTSRDYASSYKLAAKRLAETFTGDTIDDLILLPFLTLYRQAFELELKNFIHFPVGIRLTYVDGATHELEHASSEARFKKLGHNLHKLLNEAKKHYAALGLNDSFPADVQLIIGMLHEADRNGTAFRHAGQLPHTQEYVDFPDLAALLDQQHESLAVIIDYVDGVCSAAPTLRELHDYYY